jgi:hypothetical protein
VSIARSIQWTDAGTELLANGKSIMEKAPGNQRL